MPPRSIVVLDGGNYRDDFKIGGEEIVAYGISFDNYINGMFVGCFNTIQAACHEIAKSKGWHDEERNFGELVALIHSEVSELLEAERPEEGPLMSQKIPGFLAVEEEVADIIIRVLDLGGLKHWRIAEAVLAKMEYNKTRPRKHNKRF